MPFVDELLEIVPKNKKLLFLCVGTDRSTGDCYAPFVGTKLKELGIKNVFGTLNETVNALNLSDTLETIKELYPNHYVIAIDACLGKFDNVGKIEAEDKPLRAGAGVGKDLPLAGDCNIKCTVNVSGFMEYFVLQNTRLSLVLQWVNETVEGIMTFLKLYNEKNDKSLSEVACS